MRKTDGAKIHIETVSAGPYPTDEECDLAIQGEIDRAVKDYAETTFPNFGADSIKLDQKTINHLVQAREYEPTIKTSYGKMCEEHALLRFDPQVLIAIEQQCRSFVAGQRLEFSAIGLSAVLLSLGGVIPRFCDASLRSFG